MGALARAVFFSNRLTQRFERGSQLRAEQLRLFPGREVSALVDLVEVDQVAIGAPGPSLRASIDLRGKSRDGHRQRDLGGLRRGRKRRASSAALPIQPR